jgi:hypothetical protein
VSGRRLTRRREPIHASIKIALGYDKDASDSDVRKDWRDRTGRVCKPCWELKYCPYGPLVEQSPLLPVELTEVIEHNAYLRNALESGMLGEVTPLSPEKETSVRSRLKDEKLLIAQAVWIVQDKRRIDAALNSAEPVAYFLGTSLPPIHEYRTPFDPVIREYPTLASVPDSIRGDVESVLADNLSKLSAALESGMLDERKPLDDVRRAFFQMTLDEFDPNEHPEKIPDEFSLAGCNVFGHICPVFFAAEAFTETREERRRGRYISFKTKMRVVRRDNYTCQHCGKHLRDDEVEFDHEIPVSRGGSSEEHNIRLTCFHCNRDKSDDVEI